MIKITMNEILNLFVLANELGYFTKVQSIGVNFKISISFDLFDNIEPVYYSVLSEYGYEQESYIFSKPSTFTAIYDELSKAYQEKQYQDIKKQQKQQLRNELMNTLTDEQLDALGVIR